MGEALSQLAKADPDLAERIPEYRRIVALRNLLIHGYANIDERLVWGWNPSCPLLHKPWKRSLPTRSRSASFLLDRVPNPKCRTHKPS